MEGDYIVQTEYGKVRGVLHKSQLNVPYIRFLGIPYGTPPVGSLRFKVCEHIRTIYLNQIVKYHPYNIVTTETAVMG